MMDWYNENRGGSFKKLLKYSDRPIELGWLQYSSNFTNAVTLKNLLQKQLANKFQIKKEIGVQVKRVRWGKASTAISKHMNKLENLWFN